MAAVSDFDIPQDISIFQRPIDTQVDDLLIGLSDIFEKARGILLESRESSVDFGTLIERSVKQISEKTKSVETASKVLSELSVVLQDSGMGQFTPTRDREIEANDWLTKMSAASTTFLIGNTVAEPIDLSTIEIPESIQPLMKERSIEDLWCYEYALMRIGEKRIFEVEWEDQYNVGDIPALMKQWGYVSVKDPQPGDLVMFLGKEDLEPTHLGIYRGNGKVESKWWNTIPVPFLHKVEDTPSAYGACVVFYRPPTASLSEESCAASSTGSPASSESDGSSGKVSISPSSQSEESPPE